MSYYSCPECALTVQSVAGRFTTRICPRCSLPLERVDQTYSPEREPAAISRCFAAEPRAAAEGRRALEMLLWRLDPAQAHVAALLTTELIANAVEHSSSGAYDSVRLDVALTHKLVRVDVADGGAGFRPAPRAADAPLDSHWGLHLVEALADRWGVAAGSDTRVWFELDRCESALAGERSQPTVQVASG
jgi:anti-sigma regulatory factor (Ser/Thr protein kinase)